MKNELNLLDRIGGPWHIMRVISIFIVFGLIISQSMDIYGYYTELKYVSEDSIILSWDRVDNPELRFYLVEIEDTSLISHGIYRKGATLTGSMKSKQPSIKIPLQNNHSYMFWVRAVFSDGSISESINYDSLIICELPENYIPREVVSGEKLTVKSGKLSILESIDIYDSEDIRPFISDLNNDGLEDLIIGKKDGTIDFYKRLMLNGGKKLDFEYPQPIISDNQILDVGENASPFVFDYNKDGLKDMFVGSREGKVILFTNVGNENIPQFDRGKVLKSVVDDPALGMFVTVCATDWNNDGNYDLVTGNDEGYVNLYINNGTDSSPAFGSFEPLMVSEEELLLQSYTQPLIYDWNGDGRKDLLVADSSGTTFLFLNEGKDSDPKFYSIKSVIKVDGIPTISISETGDSFKILIGSQDGYINFYN
jgi:hypothetical protein